MMNSLKFIDNNHNITWNNEDHLPTPSSTDKNYSAKFVVSSQSQYESVLFLFKFVKWLRLLLQLQHSQLHIVKLWTHPFPVGPIFFIFMLD